MEFSLKRIELLFSRVSGGWPVFQDQYMNSVKPRIQPVYKVINMLSGVTVIEINNFEHTANYDLDRP